MPSTTAFGTVRAYRFDGPAGTPVVLLPGRNASTPMYRTNLPSLLRRRTVYSIDLLGEAGLSVQQTPIAGPDDHARWLDVIGWQGSGWSGRICWACPSAGGRRSISLPGARTGSRRSRCWTP